MIVTHVRHMADFLISEALRMYPAFEINSRICTKTYTFSDNGLTIEPGQTLWFPTGPYQRDAKYFPDPDTFDPLRWQGEKPGLFTTFGLGPRLCLGGTFFHHSIIIIIIWGCGRGDIATTIG